MDETHYPGRSLLTFLKQTSFCICDPKSLVWICQLYISGAPWTLRIWPRLSKLLSSSPKPSEVYIQVSSESTEWFIWKRADKKIYAQWHHRIKIFGQKCMLSLLHSYWPNLLKAWKSTFLKQTKSFSLLYMNVKYGAFNTHFWLYLTIAWRTQTLYRICTEI